ncbi:MAG: redoxin family protein [Pseudomonadota bacterium]
MRLFYTIPLAIFLFIMGLGGFMLTQTKDEAIPSGMVSKPLPEFELPAAGEGLKGSKRADLIGGEPKLLNFWGSWCVPCIAEAPHLEALKAEGVEIVGIALRDTPEDVANFLATNGNPYSRVGLAEDFSVMFEFGGSGVPETFVVDAAGTIRYQHIGDIREEHVPMLLDQLEKAR